MLNDFVTVEKLERLMADKNNAELNLVKLNEEVNLLYVAVTRTRNSLYVPEKIMPKNFPSSTHIHVERKLETDASEQSQGLELVPPKLAEKKKIEDNVEAKAAKKENEKAYSLEEIRLKHREAYSPWTDELDEELTLMYCDGVNVKLMAHYFGRTKGAILSRIKKLELEDHYGQGVSKENNNDVYDGRSIIAATRTIRYTQVNTDS